jgi:hypothetical protein
MSEWLRDENCHFTGTSCKQLTTTEEQSTPHNIVHFFSTGTVQEEIFSFPSYCFVKTIFKTV